MTVARSVARAVASPVARAVGSGIGGGGTDADAAAYFAAVEGAGGSFDLSGINATYNEDYVKDAHSVLFTKLKSDGVWAKITELILNVGKTWAGITIKAKGAGVLTNNNFVIGDYVSAGASAGLTGNGVDKTLVSGTSISGAQVEDLHIMVAFVAGNKELAGFRSATSVIQVGYTSGLHYHAGNPGRLDNPGGDPTNSIFVGTSGSGRVEIYDDGTSKASGITNTTSGTPNPFTLFDSGRGADYSTSRILAASFGTELTDTDAANLTTAIENFLDALGAGLIT